MSRAGEIRARLDAATPGPWELASADSGPHDFVVHAGDGEASKDVAWSSSRRGRDADLIAHAPADLRDLLAVVDAARDTLQTVTWNPRRQHAELGTTGVCDTCGETYRCSVARLREALARLDAVTDGER